MKSHHDKAPANPGEVLWTIERGPRGRIHVAIRRAEESANLGIDVRLWFEPQDRPGKWEPTRKGIWLRLNEAREVAEGLLIAADTLEGRANAQGRKLTTEARFAGVEHRQAGTPAERPSF